MNAKKNRDCNILLLNPPFTKKIQRDFLCSASSKAKYYWPPIDFVVLSGILKDYNVTILDCIIENKNISSINHTIRNKKIDFIITLCSAVSLYEDLKTFKHIKLRCPKVKIIVIGDIAFFESKNIIKNKYIDAILLDFSSQEIKKYIKGDAKVKDILFKNKGKIIFNSKSNSKTFSYDKCQIDLFKIRKYNIPYGKFHPFLPILVNYGCQFNCTFCASNKIGFKQRTLDEVVNEIKYYSQQGIKEVFIRDFTFTVSKERTRDFCQRLINEKINIAWSCHGRVNQVDSKILKLMKKAGCYLIFFGVESGNQDQLNKIQKGITIKQIKNVFEECNKLGLKTLASFIIGLPNDTKEGILDTIILSKKLRCNYASFNLYVPRHGSVLGENILKKIKIKGYNYFDSSTDFYNLTKIPFKEVIELHKYAIKKFYFSPKYIIRQIKEIDSWIQLKYYIINGLELIKRLIKHE